MSRTILEPAARAFSDATANPPYLFDLGPVEMAAHVEEAGGAFVGPGDTSEESVLELEPGTYEVVCFVPSSVDQRPHFDHGMHRTLEVT